MITSYHDNSTDDGSTVNLFDYTGCSDCSCVSTLRTDFNVNFNPAAYPDRDTFNCSGTPCPYYIIEDGTAHPSGQCPFDVGKGGQVGGNYATWQVKLLLEGCQTSGDTSLLMKCSSSQGIQVLNFGNDACDFDPNNGGGNTHNSTLPGGEVECNVEHQGTGRSFFCSEEEIPTTQMPTETPTTSQPTTVSPTTAIPTQSPLEPGKTRVPSSAPTTAAPTTAAPTTDGTTTTQTITAQPTENPVETDDDTEMPTTAPNDSSVGNPSSNDAYRPTKAGFSILFVIFGWIVYIR